MSAKISEPLNFHLAEESASRERGVHAEGREDPPTKDFPAVLFCLKGLIHLHCLTTVRIRKQRIPPVDDSTPQRCEKLRSTLSESLDLHFQNDLESTNVTIWREKKNPLCSSFKGTY
ncbi:hypothetical protein CEXT_190481 [Caerostris extrusa]|uniref:Uncharacterized protein n=1 Tax=Caerostris extrusa TaxID=172846 RepID=A0AAV4VPJ2_CAEEX|nr:hypothetical protein CEXT_190481 [Caerostris extrusa]